jgi:glycosyltransferase involved in cell wall biosynthesis
MAAQICKLAGNPDLRHRLGQAGRLAISQKYSQQRFSDEYAAMIDDLMAKAS